MLHLPVCALPSCLNVSDVCITVSIFKKKKLRVFVFVLRNSTVPTEEFFLNCFQ